MIDWTSLFLWQIGWILTAVAKGNLDGAGEMCIWLKIHITYPSKCTGKERQSLKKRIEEYLTILLGLMFIMAILTSIIKIISIHII